MNQTLSKEILTEILAASPKTAKELDKVKRDISKRYSIPVISHTTLLEGYKQFAASGDIAEDEGMLRLLKRRAVRTLSGVAPITVLTKPYPCPGRCVYCPTEARMPKSYLSSEPAAQRALQNEFDPHRQVESRIRQLTGNGHTVDKIELIVLGGTWSFYPPDYQEEFIQRCFDAANGISSKTLEEAQKINETADRRIIGVTLETRPDYITEKELWRMRKLGCTHVQIGVQSLDQDVLDLIRRDDNVNQIAHATSLLKHFGFKFTYHIMPGLPGATPKKDIHTFEMLFGDERFQPDMLKIYPTVVVENSLLFHWWKDGKYKPYDDATLYDVLVEIKKRIPPYVRINRLIRDIPGDDIIDGNLVTNLRQKMQQQGVACCCIRCREPRHDSVAESEVQRTIRSYPSSGGTEHFISFESKDHKTIYAFVRVFIPRNETIKIFETPAAFVRELHTYGELIPVGSSKSAVQHIGFGKRLMIEAERVAKEAGRKKIAVISGIGVREYYKKLGYAQKKTYMIKSLA